MRESGYHFVFSIENMGALKELLDEVGMNPELYIDAQFIPPTREKQDAGAGHYEYEDIPAELYLELVTPLETEGKEISWRTYKAVSYQETKEDKASGMAYPPRFIEEKIQKGRIHD